MVMGEKRLGIKESFQSVTGYDKTKIFLAFRCQNQQPLPDGRRQMRRVSSGERLQVWLYQRRSRVQALIRQHWRMQNLLETHVSFLPRTAVSLQDAPQ
jgi:hypothetical protein